MPTDLTVVLSDEPGQLATLAGATGAAGVNIDGTCAFTGEGRGIIHVLVADDAVKRAVSALEDAGMAVADRRPVLVIDVDDRPAGGPDGRGRFPAAVEELALDGCCLSLDRLGTLGLLAIYGLAERAQLVAEPAAEPELASAHPQAGRRGPRPGASPNGQEPSARPRAIARSQRGAGDLGLRLVPDPRPHQAADNGGEREHHNRGDQVPGDEQRDGQRQP